MTGKNMLNKQSIDLVALARPMAVGAVIAFILISIFLMGVDEPKPEWPRFWMLRPLIVVPLAGALGGSFSYFVSGMRSQGLWGMIAANVLTVIVYLIVLWLGTVAGLDGTLWN